MVRSSESGNPFAKKSFEICYSVFRIAGILPGEGTFAEYIKKHGLNLLEKSIIGEFNACRKEIEALIYLLRIGENTGIVHPNHSEIVIGELQKFEAIISDTPDEAEDLPANLHLDKIFTPISKKEFGKKSSSSRSEPAIDISRINAEIDKVVLEETSKEISAHHLPAKNRQNAVLERIRQSGNLPDGCRIKDLQDTLPDISERTLRYDLQMMIEQGVIERFGSGGPKTYYRVAGSQNPAKETPLPNQDSFPEPPKF